MSSKGSDGVLEATGYEANLNSPNTKLMSALLCAALYPNVVQVRSLQGEFIISLDDGWIRFTAASHEVAELDQLLEEKIRNPSMDLISCP